MAETHAVRLGTRGRSLVIDLLRRPFPDAATDWDRDAIDARVSVEEGGSRAECTTTIWSHEMVNLRALLAALGGRPAPVEAVFRFRDGAVAGTFRGAVNGLITARFDVCPSPDGEGRLSIAIEADGDQIADWLQSLDAAVRAFPLALDAAALRGVALPL